jgi:hypothetical protein
VTTFYIISRDLRTTVQKVLTHPFVSRSRACAAVTTFYIISCAPKNEKHKSLPQSPKHCTEHTVVTTFYIINYVPSNSARGVKEDSPTFRKISLSKDFSLNAVVSHQRVQRIRVCFLKE